MKTIIVVDLLDSPVLLSHDKGNQLLEELKKSVGCGERIVVDFEGYQFISSTFLNTSFGQLCIDNSWDKDTFEKNIEIVNLSKDDLDDLSLSVYNASLRNTYIRMNLNPNEYFPESYT